MHSTTIEPRITPLKKIPKKKTKAVMLQNQINFLLSILARLKASTISLDNPRKLLKPMVESRLRLKERHPWLILSNPKD